ncbi:UDP-glucose 4-epimerase [Caldalkalibacillus uzonensis]|uniref:UDP-glucose 4-epimerase n=1 Tax=Caldalkalibacillus uzonensis TaxID=353224 RepID=A0ABU0CT08_9BACI|nr:SDR family oxidoreductase [Caldalkalibacillus uzonensis]MDQ0339004.1 UDP-glucose 4-epimerase [Caldalkalibacillus uzonensis]
MTVYLVTGGAGFIGSHIVHALVQRGKRVRVLDDLSTGHKHNLQDVLSDIELIKGDLTDARTVNKAVQGVDVIFHQGAVPSVPKSIKNPLLSNDVNVSGTVQLLHAAVNNGVGRVIYAASSSVYGNSNVLPKREDMPANPLSPYAVSKYAGELYCKVFHDVYGLETISLRYFNVFGPKQDPQSEYAAVIPKFIQTMIRNGSPTIFGDGTQSRDFTYIDNVVLANLLASQAPRLRGETVNIGCGESTTLNHLVHMINTILNKQITPRYAEERQGDVKHSLADYQHAYQIIGYQPIISVEEGLKRTVEWFKAQE